MSDKTQLPAQAEMAYECTLNGQLCSRGPSACAGSARRPPAPQARSWRAALGSAALVGLAAVGTLAATPGTAYASGPTGATFTFSGSLRGALTMNGCTLASGYGDEFQLYGKLKGIWPGPENYTVDVNANKKSGGTFSKFPRNGGVSVVLQASNSVVVYVWYSAGGAFTTSPKGTGNINIKMTPEKDPFSGEPGKGTVYIKGSWSCSPGI